MESAEAETGVDIAIALGEQLNKMQRPIVDVVDGLTFLLGDALSQVSGGKFDTDVATAAARDLTASYAAQCESGPDAVPPSIVH